MELVVQVDKEGVEETTTTVQAVSVVSLTAHSEIEQRFVKPGIGWWI